MKKQNIIVYLFTAVFFFGFILLLLIQLKTPSEVSISFSANTDNGVEEVDAWYDGDDTYYVFLPAYASLEDTVINIDSDCTVYADGKALADGSVCDVINTDSVCTIESKSMYKTYEWKLVFLESSDVHTMHIDTLSGTMDYIHDDKKYEESATYSIYTPDGAVCNSGNIAEISGHGNTTWEEYDKKSYSVTLQQSDSLLSMGEAQRWILLANADDPSNIRNKFVYDFAKELGLAYSPDSRWVDLYLNGEYAGLYLLCERNEANVNRVDIEGENSFLVSLELDFRLANQNLPTVTTALNQSLRVHYPTVLTQTAADSIKNRVESIERAITAQDGIDTVSGKHWSKLIDTESWAKKYLIEEVFGNLDAGFISQYFYYDGSNDSPVYAGPVWDYGYSMGNPYVWQLSDYRSVYADRLDVKAGYTSPLFYYLMRDEVFKSTVTDIYTQQFEPLLLQYFDTMLDAYIKEVSSAAELNRIRWFDEQENMISCVEDIREYLTDRRVFLESYWADTDSYHFVCADRVLSGNLAYFAVRHGGCLSDIPSFDDIDGYTFAGWKYSDTGEAFDISAPVTEDVNIYADWQKTKSDKADMAFKLVPVALISMIFMVIFVKDIRRTKGKVRK